MDNETVDVCTLVIDLQKAFTAGVTAETRSQFEDHLAKLGFKAQLAREVIAPHTWDSAFIGQDADLAGRWFQELNQDTPTNVPPIQSLRFIELAVIPLVAPVKNGWLAMVRCEYQGEGLGSYDRYVLIPTVNQGDQQAHVSKSHLITKDSHAWVRMSIQVIETSEREGICVTYPGGGQYGICRQAAVYVPPHNIRLWEDPKTATASSANAP